MKYLSKEDSKKWALFLVGRKVRYTSKWGGGPKLVIHARPDIVSNTDWVFEVEGVNDGFYPHKGFGEGPTAWKLCDQYGREYSVQPTNAQFLDNPNWPSAESDSPRVKDASYSEKACDCPLTKLMSFGCDCGGI